MRTEVSQVTHVKNGRINCVSAQNLFEIFLLQFSELDDDWETSYQLLHEAKPDQVFQYYMIMLQHVTHLFLRALPRVAEQVSESACGNEKQSLGAELNFFLSGFWIRVQRDR